MCIFLGQGSQRLGGAARVGVQGGLGGRSQRLGGAATVGVQGGLGGEVSEPRGCSSGCASGVQDQEFRLPGVNA